MTFCSAHIYYTDLTHNCTHPEKTYFVSLVFFVVCISLCGIIISCFANVKNEQGWCILMDLHQELVDALLPPLLDSFLPISYPSNKFMYRHSYQIPIK